MIRIKQPNILITGASGFIGRNLLKCQNSANANFFCIKRPSTIIPKTETFNGNIKWIYDSQITEISNLDAVLHLATSYGKLSSLDQVIFNDVVWPLKIFDSAKKLGCKKFINIDSFFSKDAYSYGYMQEYILAKRSMRECLKVMASNEGVQIYNAVLEHVYGPNDNSDKFINSTLLKINSKLASIDLTAGDQTRDFIYINDVISALNTLIAVKVGSGYEEIGIGTGIKTSLRDFLERFKSISMSSTLLNFGAVPYREGEIMDSVADTKSLLTLGWTPKFNVHLGLKLMHQSYGGDGNVL